ncbi:MAG: thermonuclease family protein [Halofilum sp. (in: g-proteobacteria)]|nr:thermonuclease family protein [Halofilum sp. (in: g-proteobacteria)]
MPRKEKVTQVIDGDTFKTNRRRHPVRLANVDAPEPGGRGGRRATRQLRSLIGGKDVTVNTQARDKYRRAVARVQVEGRSVNRAMREKLGPKKR